MKVVCSNKIILGSVESKIGLGFLPCEVRVGSSEMAVLGCLLIDGPLEVQLMDDICGSEVEVVPHDSDQIVVSSPISNSPI